MEEEREAQRHTREVASPGDTSALNVWSLNHMSDDSKSRTIINWADRSHHPTKVKVIEQQKEVCLQVNLKT